jgi:LDH2 family malate/lactate/ureidoglycolate dehydrogenase
MPVLAEATLRRIVEQSVVALGTPADIALMVAESLVGANLAGHDSHGVLHLPWYARLIREGRIEPGARARVAHTQGATARIDGAGGWGQPAAHLAADTAVQLAGQHGIGMAAIVHCNHIGRVGAYVEQIARSGMIGMAFCNASPLVAPFGSSQRVMGTNPFAWAAPAGPGRPLLVLDFATSTVAEGKLRVARSKGEALEPGLIVDASGAPSVNPDDFYNGGALQAFGLHKGSGLSIMIELLSRGIANVDLGASVARGYNGTLVLALDIAALAPIEQFEQAAERLMAQVSAAAPRPGLVRVLLPGEPEQLARQERRANGISVPESTWAELAALAGELGVDTGA